MVTIYIASGEIYDELAFSHPEVRLSVQVEDKEPFDVLCIMMELGAEWEIDYSLATIPERYKWRIADARARITRAKKEGKTIFIDGNLVDSTGCEAIQALTAMIRRTKYLPLVEENAYTLFFSSQSKKTPKK